MSKLNFLRYAIQKRVLSFLLSFVVSQVLIGQNIYFAEAPTVIGEMNAYDSSSNFALVYRRLSTNTGTPTDGRGQWFKTFYAAPSGADMLNKLMVGGPGKGFAFYSGPTGNLRKNFWNFQGIASATLDQVNVITDYKAGNQMGLNMSNQGFYSFVFNDAGYTKNNAAFYVGYTEYAPVQLSNHERIVNDDNSLSISIETSNVLSSSEYVYLRYTTQGAFTASGTSTIVQAYKVGTGNTSYRAEIPAFSKGTTVSYYLFTSTVPFNTMVSFSESEKSIAAINYDDNSGISYSYTFVTRFAITFNVDMINKRCNGGYDSVTVIGSSLSLGGWLRGYGLNNVPNTNVFSRTIFIDTGLLLEFKFRYHKAGNTIFEDGLTSFSGNRELVLTKDSILDTVCFNDLTNRCVPFLEPSLVAFTVDLGYSNPDPNDLVYVIGDFTYPKWEAGAIRMYPLHGTNGFYSVTTNVCPEAFEFTFVNGDSSIFSNQESFPNPLQQYCSKINLNGGFSREDIRLNTNPKTISYIFDSCTSPIYATVSDTALCLGKEVLFNVVGGNLFDGARNLGSGIIVDAPRQSKTYELKRFNGVTAKQISITVIDSVNLKIISTDKQVCGNASLALIADVAPGTTYAWKETISNTNVGGNSSLLSVSNAGNYLVKITNSNGCASFDSVLVSKAIIQMPNDTSLACGNSLVLKASAAAIPNATFSWSPAAGLANPNVLQAAAIPLNPTNYTLTATFGTCVLSGSVYVNATKGYLPNFSSDVQVLSTTPFNVNFYNQTPSKNQYDFQWLWNDGNQEVNNKDTVFKNFMFNGSYDISLIAEKKGTGCFDSITKSAYIQASGGVDRPNIFLSQVIPNQLCSLGSVSLNYTLYTLFAPGTQFDAELSDATGSFTSPQYLGSYSLTSSSGTINIAIPLQSTAATYKIRVTALGEESNHLNLILNPFVVIGSINGPSDAPASTLVTYNVQAQPGTGFQWKAFGGIVINGQGTNQAQVIWFNQASGSLKVKASHGCSDSSVLDVTLCAPEKTGFVFGRTDVEEQSLVGYSITPQPGRNYTWVTSGGTIQSGQGTSIIQVLWGNIGNGTVKITSDAQCADTSTLNVTIKAINNTAMNGFFKANILLFPNPATSTVFWHIADSETIKTATIYDARGVLVREVSETELSQQQAQLNGLNVGLYFIRFIRASGLQTLKLIVE